MNLETALNDGPDRPESFALNSATMGAAGTAETHQVAQGGQVTETATIDLDRDLLWMGEDGQWIGCQGHVDLTAFAEAANALSKRDCGLDDDELPWPEFEPEHHWYRPMTWEWYEKHAGGTATRSAYAAMTADGAFEPCGPDDEGAEPWTMIATGA